MNKKHYLLDNSAILHLAAMRRNHTNLYRMSLVLTEDVDPVILQKALDDTTPHFPIIIAGIRRNFFHHYLVPVNKPPKVQPEQECLAPMSRAEMEQCAFRLLYNANKIHMEVFHSLTDGYGGLTLLYMLISKYFHYKYPNSISEIKEFPGIHDVDFKNQIVDDYFTYAGKQKEKPRQRNTTLIPGKITSDQQVRYTVTTVKSDKIVQTARSYGVSATVFLTAVMMESVKKFYMQQKKKNPIKPIQIMIPVNLRKLFKSRTLHNFTLPVFACQETTDMNQSFEKLLSSIKTQFEMQNTKEHMEKVMATYTKSSTFFLYKMLPISIKCGIMRMIQLVFGENNSCISLSNLGIFTLPEEIQPFVKKVHVMLMPRIKSPYNCGIISYNGKMTFTFSRKCLHPDFDKVFFKTLASYCNQKDKTYESK